MLLRPLPLHRPLATLVLISIGVSALAHDRSIQECIEGGEFIEHAAISRDSGYKREKFMMQLQADLEAIRVYPAALRWFVQDLEDQHLLVKASEEVFDAPREPTDHRGEFMQKCLASTTSLREDVGRAQR